MAGIQPIESLAFSMHASKGLFALLLGSGLSRAAQIPTGWEVTLDLVRRLARQRNEESEPDPAEWYAKSFSRAPGYSGILAALARTAAERRSLLSSYFEPSPDDRAAGRKVPTVAHRAIARLVAGGYVRVIVTTNFDRLTEYALEEEGITPTVISTPDGAAGAMPLAHSPCTIFKVHGDYLDPRIKNTDEELGSYEPSVDRLLDQILDEYGLVVCGWSADWDIALRAAIERAPNRRFSTYWCARGATTDAASRLIKARRAAVVPISDADSFFSDLAGRIEAIEDFEKPHPLSARSAATEVKRLIAEQGSPIRLSDLIVRETEEVRRRLLDPSFKAQGIQCHADEVRRRVSVYESTTEVLRSMVSIGAYWGQCEHAEMWARSLERIANALGREGNMALLDLQKYPAMLLLYTFGIAAIANNRLATISKVMATATVQDGSRRWPIFFGVHPSTVDEHDVGRLLPDAVREVRFAIRAFDVLRELFRDLIPEDERYTNAFDRFECLLSLAYGDYWMTTSEHCWFPPRRFQVSGWRLQGDDPMRTLETEAGVAGDSWPPFVVGLFGGSQTRFNEAVAAYQAQIAERR